MSTLPYIEARDEIFALVLAAWNNAGPMVWPDTPNPDPLPNGAWLRVTLRHQLGAQVSLTGANGNTKWNRQGTLWMQVMTLLAGSANQNYTLCDALRLAFEGKTTPGCIWFRNVRLVEVGQNNGYYQNNVLVDFEYDDIH